LRELSWALTLRRISNIVAKWLVPVKDVLRQGNRLARDGIVTHRDAVAAIVDVTGDYTNYSEKGVC